MKHHMEKMADPFAVRDMDTSTPVLILGGKENALSIVRRLGAIGIDVSASGPADCWAIYSHHCKKRYKIPRKQDSGAFWAELLLGASRQVAPGHIILPCSDDAIEFLAHHETELRQHYLFDGASSEQRLALLDKQKTLDMARAAGITTPNSWPISDAGDLKSVRENAQFPLIVKPLNTARFAKVFGRKFFTIDKSFDDLEAKVELARGRGFEVTVMEMIPGPDALLSSYYTYIDDNGDSLFHFTKRVLRRYPVNSGGATYHTTDWLPETAAEGLKFFKETGFRGLGNIEFKRDLRDGRLKVIEVNARFTAAQELAVRSGAPIDLVVYCHLTGQPAPSFTTFQHDVRYWYPMKDFLAFLQLRKRGELTFADWRNSLAPKQHVSPLHNADDLVPLFGAASAWLAKAVWGR